MKKSNSVTHFYEYSVNEQRCIYCGACTSVAPGLIQLGEGRAVIVRQPESATEQSAIEAAFFNCPGSAIRRRSTNSRTQMSESPSSISDGDGL